MEKTFHLENKYKILDNKSVDLSPVNAEPSISTDVSEVTLDAISHKLIKERFFLTALELHTELIECGRELPRLRDYFSNPGNFERTNDEQPFSLRQ